MLAGGEARRFGSDKALARLDGVPLIDRALASIAPYCTALVVCGRETASVPTLPDQPEPGLGPLGGVAAALLHADNAGYSHVLTTACDTPTLPAGLVPALLVQDCAYAAEAPTIALWPARLADTLIADLHTGGNRAIRRWAESIGAVAVLRGVSVANVNTPGDLARLA